MKDHVRNENSFLRACPHCGGPASMHATYGFKAHKFFVYACCDICGARGKTCVCDEDPAAADWNTTACGDAAQAWNMRVCEEVYL